MFTKRMFRLRRERRRNIEASPSLDMHKNSRKPQSFIDFMCIRNKIMSPFFRSYADQFSLTDDPKNTIFDIRAVVLWGPSFACSCSWDVYRCPMPVVKGPSEALP